MIESFSKKAAEAVNSISLISRLENLALSSASLFLYLCLLISIFISGGFAASGFPEYGKPESGFSGSGLSEVSIDSEKIICGS